MWLSERALGLWETKGVLVCAREGRALTDFELRDAVARSALEHDRLAAMAAKTETSAALERQAARGRRLDDEAFEFRVAGGRVVTQMEEDERCLR